MAHPRAHGDRKAWGDLTWNELAGSVASDFLETTGALCWRKRPPGWKSDGLERILRVSTQGCSAPPRETEGRWSSEHPAPHQASTYLHKGVDGHDGHVGLTLGIVHQVQVYQLFQLQVVRLHTVHHVGEEGTGRSK